MRLTNIKAVIFDLDGTLIDTRAGIEESVRYTLSVLGIKGLLETDIPKFIGPPIQQSLVEVAGLRQERAQEGADIFRNYYRTKALFKAHIYKDIDSLLQMLKLKGLNIGVATFKREDYAKTLLQGIGLAQYCDAICGADNLNQLTKKDIILLAVRALGVETSSALYVGDTLNDATSAKAAAVPFVGVSWGFGFSQQMSCSSEFNTRIISRPLELLDYLFGGCI